MQKTTKSLCVFCGAQNAVPKHFLEMGALFGRMMAEKNLTLVYGGGDCGMMGAVANASLKHNGHVTGVFPVSLRAIESEHQALSEIIIVNTMHERKQCMFEKSDAFIVLPGGFGTMDEMFEILTWRQLELHGKPIVIFNYEHYWDPLIALMGNIIQTGFARPETRAFYQVVTQVDEVFAAAGC